MTRVKVLTLLVLTLAFAVASGAAEPDPVFEPAAVYAARQRRDPFVQPPAGVWRNVMTRVEIESLRLAGVIQHPNRSMALFMTRTGPKFGFLLKSGKLYRENHQAVFGITGEIRSDRTVVLRQDDRQMTYTLR